jgi:hypothetical protein
MKLVCVAIPIYKVTPNKIESESFKQVLKILKNYTIKIFTYENLNLKHYIDIAKELKKEIEVEYFNKSYFNDVNGYNRLMLSKLFYQRFSTYKFILIYQLDAWIFSDQLEYWCKNNLDYVAAPHINEVNTNTVFLRFYKKKLFPLLNIIGFNLNIKRIENGGFSLRKTKSFIRLLTFFNKKSNKWNLNEDTFFFYHFNLLFFIFKLPTEKQALNFSFELSPEIAYKLNNEKLPFGCHAFQRYNSNFWKKFIHINEY